ncbi:MAG: hypothetical protein ACFFG0_09695 [Candidatus Thorarchaeota archaeon]
MNPNNKSQIISIHSICFNCLYINKKTNYCPYYPKKPFEFFNTRSNCNRYTISIKDLNFHLQINITSYNKLELSLTTLTEKLQDFLDTFLDEWIGDPKIGFIEYLKTNNKISSNINSSNNLFNYLYSIKPISADFLKQIDIYKEAYDSLAQSILETNKASSSLFKTVNTYHHQLQKTQKLQIMCSSQLRQLKSLLHSKYFKDELNSLLCLTKNSNNYPKVKDLLKQLQEGKI